MKKLLDNKWLFLLAVTISILVICLAISLTTDRLMTPKVTLATISEGSLTYSYNTKVAIRQEADLSVTAPSDGTIEEISVLPLAYVEKGDVLATLENGEVLVSPTRAVVLTIHAEAGAEVAQGDMVFSLVTAAQPITVNVTLPKAKGEYFSVGDQVKVKAVKEKRVVAGTAQVVSRVPTEDFLNMSFEILLLNENGDFAHGDVLQVDFSKTTESYPCLVPRSALIPTEDEGRYYIYTATPTDRATEYEVYRCTADVVGENDLYAALRQNYGAGTFVVTSTDRALGERTTVRIE